MKLRAAIVSACLAAAFALAPSAFAHGTIDQQTSHPGNTGGYGDVIFQWGQSFTPTVDTLVGFDVAWGTCGYGPNPITVVIREDLFGPDLASTTVTLPSGGPLFLPFTHVDLAAPLAVTPGTKYRILALNSAICFSGSDDAYAGGGEIFGGTDSSDFGFPGDLAFRTYGPPPPDGVAPDVDVSFTPDGSDGWFRTAPAAGTVTANEADNGGSNITGISCSGADVGTIAGLDTQSAGAAITVASQGTTNVSCTATDSSGNDGAGTGSSNTATVKLDSVAPAVSLTGVTAPANGFLASQSLSSFPATVGSQPVSASGGVSDGTSGVQAVTVNGSLATLSAGSWTKANLPLAHGSNALSVEAADAAGNTAATGTTITLDRDLDDDLIENNIDGDSSASSPGVPQVFTPSARFSDKALAGGRTSGRITVIPSGMTVAIADHPSAASGVRVTVAGGPGQTTLRLDGKGSTIRLRSPGTYTITDPAADTTVETTTGGPAEVELVVGGATTLVVIDAGEEATIRETDSDANGTIDQVTVIPGAGDTITVNGTPIGPGQTLNLAPLQSTRLTIEGRREFELGTVLAAGAINPRVEPVGIRVGTYSTTIPAGRFVLKRGTYVFAGTISGVRLGVVIVPLPGGGRHAVAATAGGANLTGTRNPVTVQIRIGDDSGIAAVGARFR